MRVRGIQSGFDFLDAAGRLRHRRERDARSTRRRRYGKAFLVGLSNTLRVAIIGIVLATIARHAGRHRPAVAQLPGARALHGATSSCFRNVPLLLQLFIWYFVLTELLPPIDEALQPLPGVFFSKNGLQFPHPGLGAGPLGYAGAGFVVGVRRRRGAGRRCVRRAVRGHRPGAACSSCRRS